MFKSNKYTRIYNQIIESASQRTTNPSYTEKHHIIPKSMGGDNESTNLVRLTAREHFLCHWLLVKAVDHSHKKKMQMAFWRMTCARPGQQRNFSARFYEIAKKHQNESHRGMKRDPSVGRNISAAKIGKPWNVSTEEIETRRQKWLTNNPNNDPILRQRKIEAQSKLWLVTNPEGEKFTIRNMAQFCRDNNLHPGNMTSVAKGNLKQYRGWTCQYQINNQSVN